MSYFKSISDSEESMSAVMKRYPKQAMAIKQLTEDVMRVGECAFNNAQRELIAAFSSGINTCTYCYGTHRATAEAFGIDETLLDKLLEDVDTSPVDDAMKPVLHFVAKLTRTPSKIVEADVDSVLNAGWDENDYHYIVMICGCFNMYNRIMDGYGVENTATFRQDRGRLLATTGYSVVTDALEQ